MGPLTGWYGVRQFCKLPSKYLVADLWGPLYLAERRGTGSYMCWVVLYVDACTRMSSAYLTSSYGASGIGDSLTKHAQFFGFPAVLQSDMGTNLQGWAKLVGAERKDLIKSQLKVDHKPSDDVTEETARLVC
jgi:hypothetical protein